MTPELIIKNLLAAYGSFGLTEKDIWPNILSGLEYGLTLKAIYTGLDLIFARLLGVQRCHTSEDIAEPLGMSPDELYKLMDGIQAEDLSDLELLARYTEPQTSYTM